VEVSKTGDVRVHRIVCAVDCARGQPGYRQGNRSRAASISRQRRAVGRDHAQDGRVEQSNFHNYRLLRMNEAPTIEVHLVRNLEAPGGIGEPEPRSRRRRGNAIFAATGKRIRRLPVKDSSARL